MHLNAIGNRNVSYNQESFVTAYYDVLIHGLTITKAGFQQFVLRLLLRILILFWAFLFYFLLKPLSSRLPPNTKFHERP